MRARIRGLQESQQGFRGASPERAPRRARRTSYTLSIGIAERPGIVSPCAANGKGSRSAKSRSSAPPVASVTKTETTSYVGLAASSLPTIQGACTFHVRSEIDKLPEDECGAVLHMLIHSGASLDGGPADLLHRRSGKAPGRRLTVVTGESMEYDGQVGKSIEVKCSPSGTMATSPMGKVGG